MTMRLLCLLVGLSVATPLAAGEPDPEGEICPFGLNDPQLRFDEVQGPLYPAAMGGPNAAGPLPCGFAVPIDGTLAWVGVDVDSLPRHLSVTIDLDVTGLALGTNESVEVLAMGFPPSHGYGPWPVASVSVSADELILTWRDGASETVERSIPGSRFTLVLSADRGRPGTGGQATLSVDGIDGPPLRLDHLDFAATPIAGTRVAVVRFGVLSTFPVALGDGDAKGRLIFRPIAIETGWGLK